MLQPHGDRERARWHVALQRSRGRPSRMFSIPVVFLVGGDAPTRSMLRYLLEDDGAAVVEGAEPRALGPPPPPAPPPPPLPITRAPEQDLSPILVTLPRTRLHAPTPGA